MRVTVSLDKVTVDAVEAFCGPKPEDCTPLSAYKFSFWGDKYLLLGRPGHCLQFPIRGGRKMSLVRVADFWLTCRPGSNMPYDEINNIPAFTQTRTYMHTYIHTYIHTYNTHTHAHTHTHVE